MSWIDRLLKQRAVGPPTKNAAVDKNARTGPDAPKAPPTNRSPQTDFPRGVDAGFCFGDSDAK
ncbi:MAG TPA: hypothetical protein VGB22_05440 [candidate division Zixibacteria bacterium]|jgi:hypothetical protein